MKRLLQDDEGFILVVSMGVLIILSFIGIAGSRNTTIELQIAGNDRETKEIFYDAESAAMESAGLLNNEDDPDELIATRTSKKWILKHLPNGKDPVGFQKVSGTWAADVFPGITESLINNGSKVIKLSVVDHGIVKGKKASSIKITSSSVHGYHLYGYAARQNTWKLVEVGYRKRF